MFCAALVDLCQASLLLLGRFPWMACSAEPMQKFGHHVRRAVQYCTWIEQRRLHRGVNSFTFDMQLGTHLRAKRKREEMSAYNRKVSKK